MAHPSFDRRSVVAGLGAAVAACGSPSPSEAGQRTGDGVMRQLAVIGAPTSAGAYGPGQERTPKVLREYGLLTSLHAAGLAARDLGDTEEFRWRRDAVNPRAMNARFVRRAARQLRERLLPVMVADQRALVIGGDCTIELGVAAAARASGRSFGLVYVDLDADLNTPHSTDDGALDWMGVAHMLDIDGVEPTLVEGWSSRPLLRADQLLYYATENVRPFERAQIAQRGIAEIPISDVQAGPEAAGRRVLEWASRFERLLVHVDFDVLDYADFPIAENTRRGRGLRYGQLIESLNVILRAPNWRALTLTEINLDNCPNPDVAIPRLLADVAAALGGHA